MGLFDFINFRKKDTQPTIKELAQEIIENVEIDVKSLTAFEPLVGGSNTASQENLSLTPSDLQRLYISDVFVYAAVDAIATTLSSIPLQTKLKTVKEGKTSYEVNENTELQGLLSYPNPYCSQAELIYLIATDLVTCGETFLYLEGVGTGATSYKMPKSIYRLNPTLVEPIASEKGPYVSHYQMITESGEVKYSPKEICHIRRPNPFSSLRGLSALIAAFQNVKLDKMILEHEVNFYQKGARLGGVLTHPKGLTKAQLSAIQRSFESNYTGHRNTHRTLVLPAGMEYKVISGSSSDAQTLEKAKYNRDSIISALKVPPIKLGFLDQASYANAQVQEKFYYSDTIIPMLTLIKNALNLHGFITPPDYSILLDFDISNIPALQEDFKEKADTAKAMLDAGLTVDEVRDMIWKKSPLAIVSTSIPKTAAEIETMQKRIPYQQSLLDRDIPQEEQQPEDMEAKDSEQKSVKDMPSGDMGHVTQDVINSQASFQERVAQLTSQYIASGTPPADAALAAVNQAMTEYQPAVSQSPQEEVQEAPKAAEIAPTLVLDSAPKPESVKQEHNHIVVIDDKKYTTSMSEAGPEHTHTIFYKDRYIESSIPVATSDGHKHIYDLPTTEADTQEHINDNGKEVKVERQPGESLDDCVSRAIPKLLEEGYERDQAIAMAYSMCELKSETESKEVKVESSDPWTSIPSSKKEAMMATYKDFQDKTGKLVSTREKELGEFFSGYKEIIVRGTKRVAKSLDKAFKTKADEDDIAKILNLKELNEYIEKWIEKNHPSLIDAVKEAYDGTLPNITIDFKLTDPIVEALIKDIELEQVKYYDETTRKQLASVLKEQFAKGATITEIGRAISKKFDQISSGRAQTIARTEVLSAYSEAEELRQDEIQKAFPDKKLKRTWITMQDEFVRDGEASLANHLKLHGVEQDRGGKFNDGLSNLEYPRDPSAAAGSVINCRCTLLKELVDKE